MRHLGLIPAALLVLSMGAAVAQVSPEYATRGEEYISRDEFFMVSMPGTPQVTTTTYRAASGAMLPARVFTATEAGHRYTVTVVHYMNASAADIDAAVAHAVQSFRARPGRITHDAAQGIDGLPGHMVFITNTDGSRVGLGTYLHAGPSEHGGPGRLYILEHVSPPGGAPPIQFPQNFFLLDAAGNRLDYVTQNGQRVRNDRTAQASVGGVYGAREPATCPTGAAVAQGKPTPAQAAQYIKCTLEGVGDGTLFLIGDITVREVGDGEPGDPQYFPDIAAGQQAYPVSGMLVRYGCEREGRNVPWGRADPGKNCVRSVEANASGHCYRTTAGVWSCSMSDLVPRERTEGVAPPR
jgi:hypothetical protein